jgi:hypothetical protein
MPSRGKRIQQWWIKGLVDIRTTHDHARILDETVDYLEGLSCSSPNLFLRESVQPLQDRVDILLSEKSLYKFYCVALRKPSLQ